MISLAIILSSVTVMAGSTLGAAFGLPLHVAVPAFRYSTAAFVLGLIVGAVEVFA